MIDYPHEELGDRIWALRHNITAYDAAFVVLAETLGVPLVTCDAKLAAAPGLAAQIELFAHDGWRPPSGYPSSPSRRGAGAAERARLEIV